MKKYYEILGLENGASQEEIKNAHIKLSKDLDPKENDNLDFFVEEYNLVQEAYKQLVKSAKPLSDSEKETPKFKKESETIKKPVVEKEEIKQENENIYVEKNDTADTLVSKYKNAEKKSKSTVLVMYKLLAAKGNSACAMAIYKINGVDLNVSDNLIKLVVQGISSNPQACNEDVIKDGKGEFGLSISNPVPVFGVPSNTTYLSKLRTKDGKKITWDRVGSSKTSNIEKEIDKYEIFDLNKKKISTIFISPYHWVISKKIPNGFISENDPVDDKEVLPTSNDKTSTSDTTNSKNKNNEAPNTKNGNHNKKKDPKKLVAKRRFKIFLTTITSIILLYSILMYFYSTSKINEAKAYYEKALIRYDLEDFNRAKEDIENIEYIYYDLKSLPFFHFNYKVFEDSFLLDGDIKLNNENYEDAEKSFFEVISLNGNNKEAYYKIGNLYGLQSKNSINSYHFDNAIEYYLKAIKLENYYVFESEFLKHIEAKNYLLAIAYCDDEIENNPRSFDGYFQKARAYNKLEDYNAAIRENLIALNIKPNNSSALFNHGIYFFNEDKYADAIEYFSKSIKVDSEYMRAYYMRGRSYYSLDNETIAIKNFDKAIQIDPDYALAYSYRASSNYILKNYKKAVNDYKKAKSIDSDVYIWKLAYENSIKEYNKIKSAIEKANRYSNNLKNKTKEYNKIKIGDYFKGGIVFSKNYKILQLKIVATSHSTKKISYYKAVRNANNLVLNGYDDWYLPNKTEFTYIAKNYKTINLKGSMSGKYFTKIINDRYWIRDGNENYYMYGTDRLYNSFKTSSTARSLAVRTFKF